MEPVVQPHFCLLLCRVDDPTQPEQVVPLHRLDLPPLAPEALALEAGGPAGVLDQLEGRALDAGHELMRQLVLHQWQALDATLVAEHQRLSPPQLPRA